MDYCFGLVLLFFFFLLLLFFILRRKPYSLFSNQVGRIVVRGADSI